MYNITKLILQFKYISLNCFNNGESINKMTHSDTLIPSANEVWGKVMFLLLSVILFTGVGYVSQDAMGQTLPVGRHPPPHRQTPSPKANAPHRHTPLGRHPPMQTSTTQTPLGRHPLGGHLLGTPHPRQTRIRSTSGRYAYYGNAYLFSK